MALTVNAAFGQFREDFVDLDPDEVKKARSSRDFLLRNVFRLPESEPGFPWLTDSRLLFGSFARRTKIQPLDDIDLMIVMHGGGGYERQHSGDAWQFDVDPGTMQSPARNLIDEVGYLNSNRVLYQFRNTLSTLPHYERADLHKSGEAVTLKLATYPWSFDVVPAFGVTDGQTPTVYYLIPDGKGHWKRTDPRRDDDWITRANQRHNGLVLPTIRVLKSWNVRSKSPMMMSYWLEVVALSTLEDIDPIQFVHLGVCAFFAHAIRKVAVPCPDPKRLGRDLDVDVNAKTKQSIIESLQRAAGISLEALEHEVDGNDRLAMSAWQRIFGPAFPTYG